MEPPEPALARGLAAAGHDVRALGRGRAGAALEAALRPRKLGDGLGHAAVHALAVRRGAFDLVHAFSPANALATRGARLAVRGGGAPVAVLTFPAPVERAGLADRRLRLATLERAIAGADAVLAGDEEVAASLRRWLTIEARVLAPGDAAGHAALYAELLECRPA